MAHALSKHLTFGSNTKLTGEATILQIRPNVSLYWVISDFSLPGSRSREK